ncbi:MAG: TlpA disulfide reductase family protein [Luteolibacter sp.]
MIPRNLTATFLVGSALVSTAFGLQVGDEVKLDALAKATFIQGTVPTAWEPGKVYMFECWATWCGPCIASIPHVNELHKKYADKGLRIIGLNVYDEGPEDKIRKFVAGKGDGMSYPVAFVGKGGDFEKEWLKPAKVTGIPHTFVVKDGKLVLMEHPLKITDEVIEKLLAGGDAAKEAVSSLDKSRSNGTQAGALATEFRAARKSKDVATMAAKLAELEKNPEGARYVPSFKLSLAVAKEDWATLETLIKDTPEDAMSMFQLDLYTDTLLEAKAPEQTRRVFAEKLAKTQSGDAMKALGLLKVLVSLGEKERALSLVSKMTPGPTASDDTIKRVKEGVEKGEIPSRGDYTQWLVAEGKIKMPAH